MTHHDPDAWLDAFDPAEPDNPELTAFDRSVERLLARSVRPRRAHRRAWMLVAFAASLALIVGIGFGSRLSEPAPVEVGLEPPPTEPVPPPPEAVVPPAPARRPIAGTPAAPAAPRRPEPGLLPYDGAMLHLRDGTAILDRGVLRYVHDPEHDPGVERVRWSTLPVVATPVGTDFTVAAAADLGAIVVEAGVVRLELVDGTLLALLSAGDEIVILSDPEAPAGLRLLATGGRALDELASLAGSQARPELVALVASVRLAVHPDALPLASPR